MKRLLFAFTCGILHASASPGHAAASDPALFERLDANHDGIVEAAEIAPSQQTYFRRALRVADVNEDGALSAAELQTATTNREPVTLPVSPGSGMGRMNGDRPNLQNLRNYDRNKDGQLTADEVPPPLRPRIEEMLKRIGRDSLPLVGAGGLRPDRERGAGSSQSRSSDAEMKEEAGSDDGVSSDSEMMIEPSARSESGSDKASGSTSLNDTRSRSSIAGRPSVPGGRPGSLMTRLTCRAARLRDRASPGNSIRSCNSRPPGP
jgi:hypothetical protein